MALGAAGHNFDRGIASLSDQTHALSAGKVKKVNQPASALTDQEGVWYRRWHRALMPDYNRTAAAYWYLMVFVGSAILLYAAFALALMTQAAFIQTTAGIVLAAIVGTFPLRIPNSKNSIAAGDIFLFLMLLMLGPLPATLAAAAEAGFASWSTSKRWTSRIVSPAIAAITMLTAGLVFQAMGNDLSNTPRTAMGTLVGELIVIAGIYYALNTLLMTTVIRLKRDEPIQLFKVLRDHLWLGFTYVFSACIAGLLYITFLQYGAKVLFVATAIIVLFLATLHHYFNQLDAQSRTYAAEREAAQAARHLVELKHSEQRFHSAFTHASIGMLLITADGRIIQGNEASHRLLGQSEKDVVGRRFQEFVCRADVGAFISQMAGVSASATNSFATELRCRHEQNGEVWVTLHCSHFAESDLDNPCMILQVHDIDSRRQAESRLKHIAHHDGLTGLLNRNSFLETLREAIARERLGPRHQYAVMFLDLDRFKLVNDSMGHSAGDNMLIQVTRRIREKVRPSDVVARLGGDEFAILCTDIESENAAILLAERLQQALSVPLLIGGSEVNTSASIGITFSRFNYRVPEEVLRDADIAMYRAKNSGKARYALFDTALHTELSDKVGLERDLRRAVDAAEISLVYQPLFEIKTGVLHGFEALARWHHKSRGTVSPEEFIPVAEELGLMVAITNQVMERACLQLRAWHQRSPLFARLQMHVNIAGADLLGSALVERVERITRDAGLDPCFLALEVTEGILIPRVTDAAATLAKLQQAGVRISIDDFGTGYSSLSHLSTLPIDSLKIDRSFVNSMQPGSKESEIVRAIVSMAHALGKSVVAEGIEDESQLLQLRDLGCEFGQGYYYSRPLAAELVDAMLKSLQSSASEGGHAVFPIPSASTYIEPAK